MWGTLEKPTKPDAPRAASFLDLYRVSDAITVFSSRRRLRASNGYDDRRDRGALEQGIMLLEIPTNPMERFHHEVTLGNIVDWDAKPTEMPPNDYITQVSKKVQTTVNHVLNNRQVDSESLNTARDMFENWAVFVRHHPAITKIPIEGGNDSSLQRLSDYRNGLDRVDQVILTQAGLRNFDAVFADVTSAVKIKPEDNTQIDSTIIDAVVERRRLASEIAKVKHALGIGILDQGRELAMRDDRYEWGQDNKLTPDQVDLLMGVLITDSKRVQEETQTRLM